MRELAVAVAVSVAAHVVAVLWIVDNQPAALTLAPIDDDAADDDRSPDRVDAIAAVTADVDGDSDEMTIVLLDDAKLTALVRASDSGSRPSVRAVRAPDDAVRAPEQTVRAPDRTARAPDRTVRQPDSPVDAATVTAAVDSVLGMRHPSHLDEGRRELPGASSSPATNGANGTHGVNLALSSTTANEIVSRRAETPPGPAASDDINAADEAAGREADKLRAEIKELDMMLFSPGHLERTDGATLEAEREELARKKKDLAQMTLRHVGGGRYVSEFQKQFTANVDPDGTTHLKDAPNFKWQGLGFRFDLTDAAMRQFGDDPYQRQKMRFLDRTRQQRYEIGKAYRELQWEHSADYMRKAIDRVWATIREPAKQREALFELWDDCAETGDPKLVEAGEVARGLVMAVIRTKVKYPPDELVRLNARRTSTRRFEP